MNFDQADFEVRCEWGKQGVLQLAPISDAIIIIDVLSFSTCIDVANSRGAIVFPCYALWAAFQHWLMEHTQIASPPYALWVHTTQ